MNSSEGPPSPGEEKEQNNNTTGVFKGSGICPIHGVPLECTEVDVPIEDENGNDIFDSDGNLLTEKVVVYFCRECDGEQ